VRLLRLHASSFKNATIHRDLRENYRELKRFLGKRAYKELRRRVKEADRPIRKRSKPRRYSDEKWKKGSGAVKRKTSRHLYDATDMGYKH
jgi:hypothetical protein